MRQVFVPLASQKKQPPVGAAPTDRARDISRAIEDANRDNTVSADERATFGQEINDAQAAAANISGHVLLPTWIQPAAAPS